MKQATDLKSRLRGSAGLTRWYIAPLVVLVIGIVAVGLMVWRERLGQLQQNNSLQVEALMDIQINAAQFHLWIEQYIAGDPAVDLKEVFADIDGAIALVNSLERGGESEHGRVKVPFEDPDMLGKTAELKALLASFREAGASRLETPALSRTGTPGDKLFDDIYKKILADTGSLEDMVEAQRTITRAKSHRISQGIIVGWIIVVAAATGGVWNREKKRRAASQALIEANEQLARQAEELQEHRERLSFLVEKRTAELTTANTLLQEESLERRHAMDELAASERHVRQLSGRLLNAQEVERRRIAGELHDELGQALNVVKLRLRVIANGISNNPKEAGEECEELMAYMNLVIEDVRRLSLSLSPTVLEDLGLTSALRWLVDNLYSRSEMNVTCEIDEVDHLIPRDNWIGVYRVIQEALTNVYKHAGAENLSVIMRRDEDNIRVVIEDDGVGFDKEKVYNRDTQDKGLGLTTMSERLGMVGGKLELSTETGKGTRVAFSMPIQEWRD